MRVNFAAYPKDIGIRSVGFTYYGGMALFFVDLWRWTLVVYL